MANQALVIDLQLSAQKAEQELKNLANQAKQALNPNSKGFQKELDNITALEKKLQQAGQSAQYFAKQGEQGVSGYSKISNEMANIAKRLRGAIDDQDAINKAVEQEIALRKKANETLGGSGTQFSPHSQRQSALLQGIGMGGGLPGQSTLGAMGETGSLGGAMGVAGGMLLATGAQKAISALNDLGEKVKSTSEIFSDGGGKYDKLFKSTQDLEAAQARLSANLPIAEFETLKNRVLEVAASFLNGFLGGSGKGIGQDAKNSVGRQLGNSGIGNLLGLNGNSSGGSLRGDLLRQEKDLMHDRASMEQEQAMQREQFEHDIFTKRRDYLLEVQKFELDMSRKREDIEKDAQRKEEDYQLKKQKFDEDFEGKMAETKYNLSRQQAQRDFQLKQQYAQQDYQLQKQYKTEDFAKEQSRSAEDFNDELADMGASGASGLSYLQHVRDYRKKQRRAAEDFATQQQRDKTQFGIEQGRSKTEFANQQQDAVNARSLEIAQHLNDRKYQEIEMTQQHNRDLQDGSIALERFTQDLEIGRKELKNKGADLNFEEDFGRRKMAFDQANQQYSSDQSLGNFGQTLAKNLLPSQLKELMKNDPFAAQAVGAYTKQGNVTIPGMNGQSDLSKKSEQAGVTVGGVQDALAGLSKTPLAPLGFPFLPGKLAKDTIKNGLERGDFNPLDALKDFLLGGKASGGLISQTGPYLMHSGEYVVNPNAPDSSTQANYALSALGKMGYNAPMSGSGGAGGANVNMGAINVQAGLPADIQPMLQQMMGQFSNQISSTVQASLMKNLGSMMTRQTYLDESTRRSFL